MVKCVDVRKLEGDGNLKAFADIVIEPGILIRGCFVMQGKTGVFAAMPRKLTRDGRWCDVVLVENEELKAEIENAILEAYSQMQKSEDNKALYAEVKGKVRA